MEIIIKCESKTARDTVKALNRIERRLGSKNFKEIFKSITFDNGTEFSDTKGIEISPYTHKKRTNVYYCHAYCSSERGSNENQNGFIRRFVKKGTAIENYSPNDISSIQNFINNYPRRLLNGRTRLDFFTLELQKLNLTKISSLFHYNT